MAFPLKSAFLQADLDAKNFTILNLDLSGLNLTNDSVGLGNVNNTSDIDKPVSTATQAALDGKEDLIATGTNDQFWRGDKEWQTYGALALQDGETSLPVLSAIGGDAATGSALYARRSDYGSSGVSTFLLQNGASQPSNILAGILAANAGALIFQGCARGVIKTTNGSPLDFGTNSLLRMRLMFGLNIGGTIDPGQGCLSCLLDVNVGRNLQVDGDVIADGDLTADTLTSVGPITGTQYYAPLTTPASAGAAGSEGRICWDASYIYVCVATNTWKRVAIATWP